MYTWLFSHYFYAFLIGLLHKCRVAKMIPESQDLGSYNCTDVN